MRVTLWPRASSRAEGVLELPITLPVSVVHGTPIVTLNYDVGETIGWPALAGAAHPDAFRPDLALSLNNLSNQLAGLGRRRTRGPRRPRR